MRRPDDRFEELFRSCHPAVLGYVRRRAPGEAVDDVVNQVFLTAWRRFERVPAEPLPWLLGIARNVLATQQRSRQRREALRQRLAHQPVLNAVAPEAPEAWTITRALAALSPKDREAVLLVAWEGLSPAQAAEVLGERPGTFRVRLHRARTRLRTALDYKRTEVHDAR